MRKNPNTYLFSFSFFVFICLIIAIYNIFPAKNSADVIKNHSTDHNHQNQNHMMLIQPQPSHKRCREDNKPGQDSLHLALQFACSPEFKIQKLKGPCEHREYTWATLDETRLRILKMYTLMAMTELNRRCVSFSEKHGVDPFHFVFIQIVNATSSVDTYGNSRWKVDLLTEESTLHTSHRLNLDFTVTVSLPNQKSKKIATCAEYTSFPFPRYPFGFPTMDQMIPLPTHVIDTGPGEVLYPPPSSTHSTRQSLGIDADYPCFKEIYLNKVWIENSDLALGTELPQNMSCEASAAINDTSLDTSKYIQTPVKPSDVLFPEKDYSKCLKNKINNDIVNHYSLKPTNWCQSGKPENRYHFTGSTESYKQSKDFSVPFKGWIEPAVKRNKWPRLWSEPRDRFAWPSTPIGMNWDNLGIRRPVAKPNATHPGIRWSTEQEPRTPQYWPTVTGVPVNAGPNYWLFNNLRGGNAVDGATRPTR
jgi:hypothetical protein